MEKELFQNLLSSAKEAREISKGRTKPSRRFVFKPEDISKIRKQLNLSQNDFAVLLRVPASTLRNWEQGRTTPDAPAQTLLLIAHKRPQVLNEVAGEVSIVFGSKSPSNRFSPRSKRVGATNKKKAARL